MNVVDLRGGANPERTGYDRPPGLDTQQHERARQAIHDGTGRHELGDGIRLDTVEVSGSLGRW